MKTWSLCCLVVIVEIIMTDGANYDTRATFWNRTWARYMTKIEPVSEYIILNIEFSQESHCFRLVIHWATCKADMPSSIHLLDAPTQKKQCWTRPAVDHSCPVLHWSCVLIYCLAIRWHSSSVTAGGLLFANPEQQTDQSKFTAELNKHTLQTGQGVWMWVLCCRGI